MLKTLAGAPRCTIAVKPHRAHCEIGQDMQDSTSTATHLDVQNKISSPQGWSPLLQDKLTMLTNLARVHKCTSGGRLSFL